MESRTPRLYSRQSKQTSARDGDHKRKSDTAAPMFNGDGKRLSITEAAKEWNHVSK